MEIMTRTLPEIRVISFTRYFVPRGFSKIYRACSVVSDCQNNMARSVERCERVDYVALNNLSSADLEPLFQAKRKYKPGAKLYQVERLISKRKSTTEVRRNPYKAVFTLCNCEHLPSIYIIVKRLAKLRRV